MATATPNSLLDALRQHRLLDLKQLEELNSLHFPDPKSLAKELIQRGWLTPYQANQLLNGKGDELFLGSYILLERLGEGGMGQVFKARHRNLGRISAIKLIRKERLDNPSAVRRFQREVRSAAALSHPNIVLAYDADEIAGTHLLVMELIEGATDLAKLVKKNGPLPVDRAREYIRQAALGLQHAYERGMVHRDIKPANLLLTADAKVVKVLDMGLARLDQPADEGESSSTMTKEGAVMGTPDYIAPEQALDTHRVDIRADIYSLGCSLYYLLTGRVPFPGGSLLQKLKKHESEEPPAVEKLRPEVTPQLAGVVRKMMAKKPQERYQTPAEVARALAEGAAGNVDVPALANSPTSVESSAVGRDSHPVQAIKDGSRDSLASAFAYIDKRSDTVAYDSHQPLPKKPRNRRGLVIGLGTGLAALVGLAVLLLLIPSGEKKQPEKRPVPPVFSKKPPPVPTPAPSDAAQIVPVPEGKAVDLLGIIDLKRDVVQGDWAFLGNKLVTVGGGSGAYPRLVIPYAPPPEYQIEMDVKRTVEAEGQGLNIGFPIGQRQAMVVVDGFAQPTSGLETIDKKNANANETTHKGRLLPQAQITTVLLQVRKKEVIFICAGRTVFKWQGDPARLKLHPVWAVPNPRSLFLGSQAVFHIEKMTLTPLGPTDGATTAPAAPIDLLPLIDPAKDAVHGDWKFNEKGDLVSDKAQFARIRIPYRPPAEYDLLVSFTKLSGPSGPSQILVGGGRQFRLEFGAWNNSWSYFEMVDGKFGKENRTAKVKTAWLTTGKRHESRVEVRKDSVKAYLDSVLATELLQTDFKNVNIHPAWDVKEPGVLGLVSFETPMAFHKVQVVEISGPGTFTRPAKPPGPWRPIPLDPNFTAWQVHDTKARDFKVTEIEKEPVLHFFKDRSAYLWPKELFGDFHLRLDFKFPGKGGRFDISWARSGGGVFGFRVIGDGTVSTGFGEAAVNRGALERGAIVSRGPLTDRTVLAEVGLKPTGDWNQLDLVRLGSAFAVFVNGRFAGATTDLRWLKDKEEIEFPRKTFAGTLQCAGTLVRRIQIRDISALPPELLAPGPWRSLFNGKDFAGWTPWNPKKDGKAEYVSEDGKPAIRIMPQFGLATRPYGNFHLRFEAKSDEKHKGPGIGIIQGGDFRFGGRLYDVMRQSKPILYVAGAGCSYQEAVLRNGRIEPVGETSKIPKLLGFSVNPAGPWVRMEIIRQGDSLVYVVNGKVVGAITNLRDIRKGKEELLGPLSIQFMTDQDGSLSVRNVEIRDISALPPELFFPSMAIAPFDAKKAQEYQRLWAIHLGRAVEETNSVGMKLRLIPPGEFRMGDKEHANSPPRTVRLTRPFYMSALEVTRKQYVDLIKDPAKIPQWVFTTDLELPMGGIDWDEAAQFCSLLSAQAGERKAGRRYRLPTEAEWEYACRAGTTTRFHFGDSATPKDANFRFADPKPAPLKKGGAFAANAWGLFDMHGNSREWCADWYDKDYPTSSPLNDPPGPPTGTLRLTRGGGGNDSTVSASFRYPFNPATKNFDLGFRVVCEIVPPALAGAFPPLDPDGKKPSPP